MSDISVTVTNAGTSAVSVSGGSTISPTVGNGGSVSVAIGGVTGTSPTVVSGTVEIGSVTTLATGSSATVTNSGTGYHAILDFGLPRGAAGPANSLAIGTVTSGSTASATITGTAPSQTLNLVLPKATNGITPAFKIGTVTTGSAGSSASVTATTTNNGANVSLDFTIPRGDTGATGSGGSGAVTSVAGRTGAVVIAASDVSGLATIATSGSASNLATGTVPVARLPLATTSAAGVVQVGSGLAITSGVLSVTGGAAISWVSPPASPSSGGAVGQLAQDANYLYVCYAAGSWLRVARDPWVVAPSAPQNVSATGNPGSGITAGSVAVTWSAPASTGGELTGYLVQVNGGTAVSLGPTVTSHTFTSLTYSSSTCNAYTVSVRAVNSAGQSEAATDTANIPESTTPTIYSVTKTPNEGAPGVEYGVYWFRPCVGSWNQYELQLRLYYNGSEVVVSGDEDGWEAGYSGPNQSLTTQTSSTGSQQYQFRVRAKNVTGSTVVATSGWSAVATS